MAVFIVQSLVAPVKISDLAASFDRIKKEFEKKEPKTKKEISKALNKYTIS